MLQRIVIACINGFDYDLPMPAMGSTEGAWLLTHQAPNTSQFRTTLWTTVLTAGRQSAPGAEAALGRLCQIYWRPVYAYVRKRTSSPEQAQDLTQGFFARFLEKNYVARAQPARGRFRCFLMTSVEHFLCDEHDRATSLKRGGGQGPLSLDVLLPEEEHEPASDATPALAFEKRWAKSLLDVVMRRLREEYEGSERALLFERLQCQLWGETDSLSYEQLARHFGLTSVHLRVTAHRMRQRYREILREEIAQTVSSPREIEAEIRYLLQVVST